MKRFMAGRTGIIPLGKQGENLAKEIVFDVSDWVRMFGPGTAQLIHQRKGDAAPYPVACEQDGMFVLWPVKNVDTAASGDGRAELQYYVGDTLAKSETWVTKVARAIGAAGAQLPEAQQAWVDRVLTEVAKVTGMTVRVSPLPVDDPPTAQYESGVLTLGIPLGGTISTEKINKAVADWLEANPINGNDFVTDETLSFNLHTKVLSVNTANVVEQDNTLPVTSAAVQEVVGNINVLLGTV